MSNKEHVPRGGSSRKKGKSIHRARKMGSLSLEKKIQCLLARPHNKVPGLD